MLALILRRHSRIRPALRFLELIGGHELGTLLAFAGLLLGVWLFWFIASQVVDGGTGEIDRRILLSFRRPVDLSPAGGPVVLEMARDITALGSTTVLTLITVFTGGYLLLAGRRHLGLFIYGAVGSGMLVSTLLKGLFDRPRPDIVPHESLVFDSSFPSGHSMLSAVTWLTLGALLARTQTRKRLRAYFLLTAALLTFLVGVSRVYLGVHWPTDVLAGWTAGITWAMCWWLIARQLQRAAPD
jgi:undecaprenyl-diphosphatase